MIIGHLRMTRKQNENEYTGSHQTFQDIKKRKSHESSEFQSRADYFLRYPGCCDASVSHQWPGCKATPLY